MVYNLHPQLKKPSVMKKLMILLVMCTLGLHTFSQVNNASEEKTNKKLTKEQKQAQRKAEAEAKAIEVDLMIQRKQFVVEANYIGTQNGTRVSVNGELNFIMLDTTEISIQIAPRLGANGGNGMGGITADGSITKWEMKKFGKTQQLYSIRMYARFTRAGFYDIVLTVNPDGTAQATLNGPDAAKILFYGQLKSLQQSRAFKGSTI
jgi:hypothetical protein